MFGNYLLGVTVASLAFTASVYHILEAERSDTVRIPPVSTENYICVIPDFNPELPCRVKMREDVYIQNEVDSAPKD